MKRILRILVLAMAILLTVPVYAAPKGYKEVKITKKNAAKYFSFRKGKLKDEFGDYDGYRYYLYSSMRKKGYYVYSMPGVALKISYKYRYKIKQNGRWYPFVKTATNTFTQFITPVDYTNSAYNYNYAKIYDVKFKKAKGKLILIEPKNVIKIEKQNGRKGGNAYFRIRLRYPYDSRTPYISHTDPLTGEEVIDYYYVDTNANPYNSLKDIYASHFA